MTTEVWWKFRVEIQWNSKQGTCIKSTIEAAGAQAA